MPNEPLPKKSLGQHWLNDTPSLEAMLAVANVTSKDTVLEIGPGLGSLTKLLVRQAGQVIAVELDRHLVTELTKNLPAKNLHLIQGDILQFDFTSLTADYKIIANIPYYLTANLIRVISETINVPLSAVLLVQKEVAKRVAAAPGQMSLLSVTAQFYWQIALGQLVPAELFEPPPKVDSQVLILQRRPTLLFPDVDVKQFFRLAKAGFAQRRKTLLNSLSSGLHLGRPEVENLCQTAGIDPTRRAQTLGLDEWHRLYQAMFNDQREQ